jgi:hypothetical protein
MLASRAVRSKTIWLSFAATTSVALIAALLGSAAGAQGSAASTASPAADCV